MRTKKTAAKKINKIVKNINTTFGSHSKHFDFEFCKRLGLNVERLEIDNTLQDLILTVYHSCNITSSITPAAKIIQNNEGYAYITFDMTDIKKENETPDKEKRLKN